MKLTRDFFMNIFRSKDITPERFLAFAKAVLANLIEQNTDDQYKVLITLLTTLLAPFATDITDIDTNMGGQKISTKNGQKISTKKMKAFLKSFVTFMTQKPPFIAAALGGTDTDGYLSIYPSGVSEYHKANYKNASTLTERIKIAATTYKTQLGDLATPMLGFSDDFTKLYDSHQAQKGKVKTERASRTETSLQLQLGMTTAVFTVSAMYPGNAKVCEAIFPFSMLYPQKRRKTLQIEGELAVSENKQLMNYQFSTSMDIMIDNTGSNSDLGVWLSAAPTDARPAKIVIVKAGEAPLMKVYKLGNLEKTFLMIANLSAVNTASYTVEMIGLRKEKKEKPAPKKEATKKMNVEDDVA